eukprot:scaffold17004_cov19-Tisochrysis_lutea.AAC.1
MARRDEAGSDGAGSRAKAVEVSIASASSSEARCHMLRERAAEVAAGRPLLAPVYPRHPKEAAAAAASRSGRARGRRTAQRSGPRGMCPRLTPPPAAERALLEAVGEAAPAR